MDARIFVGAYATLILSLVGVNVYRQTRPIVHNKVSNLITNQAKLQDNGPVKQVRTDYEHFVWTGHWSLSGTFKGKVVLKDAGQSYIFLDAFQGSDPNGYLRIYYREQEENGKNNEATYIYDFVREFNKIGTFAIVNNKGTKVGEVELKPWGDEEQEKVDKERNEEREAWLDYLKTPERLSPVWSRGSFAEWFGGPGVATGYVNEIGVGWKLFGYAKVRATYPGAPQIKHKTRSGLRHDIQKVRAEAEARIAQAPAKYQNQLRLEMQKQMDQAAEENTLTPDPSSEPVIYWSVSGDQKVPGLGYGSADPVPGYATQVLPANGGFLLNREGRWPKVKESGKVFGYGHHEIKDSEGKVVLILDVTPLTESKETR